jgi:preprotein translocase subunit YajC
MFSIRSAVLLISLVSLCAAQQDGGGASALQQMLPMMLIMFVIIYFFMIRPEQKKQKKLQEMRSAMKKGDKVVTTGGIHGTVNSIKDATVMVKVANDTTLEFSKTALTVLSDTKESQSEKKGKA